MKKIILSTLILPIAFVSCNQKPLKIDEAIGIYERAFESSLHNEKLELTKEGKYYYYFENKKTGEKYTNEGIWKYEEKPYLGKRILFFNWIYRDREDTSTHTFGMIFDARIFSFKECIVLGRGIDDTSDDFIKKREDS